MPFLPNILTGPDPSSQPGFPAHHTNLLSPKGWLPGSLMRPTD